MFGEVWLWAGSFRITERNIGVAPYNIQPELRKLFEAFYSIKKGPHLENSKTFSKKNEFNQRHYGIKFAVALFLVCFYTFTKIVLGQRTFIILFSISFLFIYFKKNKMPRKYIFIGLIFLFALMSFMRLMDLFRSGGISNFLDIFSFFISIEDNPIIDFLGDIGWNLMTLMEFQKMQPQTINYSYGFSYLVSLTSIIPNINLWSVHPAYLYGDITRQIREYLGFKFGIGSTPIAEAYCNFGHFGILVFYLWGRFTIFLNKKYENDSIIGDYFVALFIGILLKSCVRSNFTAVFRPFILYVVLPTLIVKILCYKYRVKYNSDYKNN